MILAVSVGSVLSRKTKDLNVLYAFYDLGISPVTFDIIQFLVLAETERRNLGCDSVHIVFVPGPKDGFSPVEVSVYQKLGQSDCDVDLMRWRLRNILVPLCWLIPSCRGVTVCSSIEEAQILERSIAKYVFPRGYTVQFPKESFSLYQLAVAQSQGNVPYSIQAPVQARRFVSEWIKSKSNGKKVITISVRNCPYQPERNSNIKAWREFICSLDPALYCPIIVDDTWTIFKSSFSGLKGLITFSEASWNMELRIAMYELSYLNLSVSCGPVYLCVFDSRTRYLVFSLLRPPKPNLARFFRSEGFEVGFQFKHAGPFQRLVWKDDTFPVIREEFDKICDKIDNGG